MKKRNVFVILVAALVLFGVMAAPALARRSSANLLGGNWRVFNVEPATAAYWDINSATVEGGAVQFPFQPFLSTTTGSFAAYLLLNYKVDLTGKTISAAVSWTPGLYLTRRDPILEPGAYVRLEFQDTTGPYNSNDYWWSTVDLNLNTVTSGTLTASLTDRTLWTNQSGKSATDTTKNWLEWQGDIVHMSPYDGFTQAMKNVKAVSLSFGCPGYNASGVAGSALDGSSATFTMTTFTVTP